jgi:hypothetical protein
MNNSIAMLLGLLIGIVIGAAVMYMALRARTQARSKQLRERFGPEYGRAVAETGDRTLAETKLEDRERRVRGLHIRSLDGEERARFQEAWRNVQARFVDDPAGALSDADGLLSTVMSAEGYPMNEFELRAADISVDHPVVVENYREGHRIAARSVRNQATTEELREAMIHYRKLFEDLVGAAEWAQAERTRS